MKSNVLSILQQIWSWDLFLEIIFFEVEMCIISIAWESFTIFFCIKNLGNTTPDYKRSNNLYKIIVNRIQYNVDTIRS